MSWTMRLRSLWPQRLYHQLVWMVSLALLMALGLLGWYTVSEQSRIAIRSYESQAATLVRNVAIASSNPILTDSLDQLEELVVRSADFEEVVSLQVLTADGHVLSEVVRQAGRPPHLVMGSPSKIVAVPVSPQPQLGMDEAGQTITAWHPIKATRLIGWVRLDYNARALAELRSRIWRNTLIVAVLAVSFCASAMAWRLRAPMRALNRARGFAIELVNSNGHQMPVPDGPFEVRELMSGLNEASVLLKQQLLLIEDGLRQHHAHEARLAEQNEQLGAIFALSHDGLVTFDSQGHALFVNQAFMRLTGLRPSQVIGKSLDVINEWLLQKAAPGSSFKGLASCFSSGDQTEANEQILIVAGERRTVLSVSGRISQSEAVSRVLYVCDVTKQHTLDQMKSEFLSMAAHELRTPMVSILGFTELMLKREMNDAARKDMLGSVYRQSQSMAAILNELLDLARIEARRGQDFKLETVDLADVIKPVIADYKAPSGRDAPIVDEALVPMPVHVDVHKLQQAVLNVLSNAYKYSPDGGPVYVRYLVADAEQGRHRFAVEIEDRGIGMSADNLTRLGERFFRVDKSGNIPGTGLGVSIVKELMELMGGRMQVRSEPGQGTTVTLWL